LCRAEARPTILFFMLTQKIAHIIAEEIKAHDQQVIAAITLLDEGATVPFIARYRKEITGGLDDT
jgi:protein Tex